jgi:hypothetical protein
MQRFQVAVRFHCHKTPVRGSAGVRVLKVVVATLVLNAIPLGAAFAGSTCDAPVAEWQPREVLRSKLEAYGWRVRAIKALDGCYQAEATDSDGVEVHALFDPKTLKRVDRAGQDGAG